jgi:hypothetical protein
MISSWALSSKDGIDGADFDGDSEALDTTGTDFFVFVLVRPMVQDFGYRLRAINFAVVAVQRAPLRHTALTITLEVTRP